MRTFLSGFALSMGMFGLAFSIKGDPGVSVAFWAAGYAAWAGVSLMKEHR